MFRRSTKRTMYGLIKQLPRILQLSIIIVNWFLIYFAFFPLFSIIFNDFLHKNNIKSLKNVSNTIHITFCISNVKTYRILFPAITMQNSLLSLLFTLSCVYIFFPLFQKMYTLTDRKMLTKK